MDLPDKPIPDSQGGWVFPDGPQMTNCSPRTPAQVDVAFDVVRWVNSFEGRELSPKERSVYEAALEVMRLYITGEMMFGGDRVEPEPVKTQKEPCFFCKK